MPVENFENLNSSVRPEEIITTTTINQSTPAKKVLKRPEVKIDWRIYTKNPENPLIRDLIIEGLSLARTQKEEFSSILSSNNGDIKVLFSTLEKFINN